MGRVASIAGCHGAGSRSDEAQCAGSGNALSTIGVTVGRIASVGGSSGTGSRRDEAQCSSGGDALGTIRVAMSRVASVASCAGSRSDKAQCTGSGDALGTIRVAVGWVARIARAGRRSGSLGEVGSRTGTILAVASVVLTNTGGQCARAGDLRRPGSNA